MTDVLVIGTGAVGCAVAAVLADQGRDVVLAGVPQPTDASQVAAGMIAPLSEAALDPAARDGAAVLDAGAGLWPAFAERFGVPLRRCGGLLLAPDAPAGERARLPGERIDLSEARSFAPLLEHWEGAIQWLAEECAVDAAAALACLAAELVRRGGRRIEAPVTAAPDGSWRFPGGRIRAGRTVLATGQAGRAMAGEVPELGCLSPIRGQILRTAPGTVVPSAPFIRGPGAYVVPQSDGTAMIGATMEAGTDSLAPSDATTRTLMGAVDGFAPTLASQAVSARVGIRAATPDALPRVGPCSRPDLFLATGLRRNGWLLAPLVAGMIADYLAGRDPGPYARRLDPQRFERP